ncbi:MAG: hypothetical protein HOO06_09575 [Bdellovibrionaceae bacterium]|jgi:hypothetical protein|nr:hypothetical protein [Pseudobdellovibrionaceae bacterium]
MDIQPKLKELRERLTKGIKVLQIILKTIFKKIEKKKHEIGAKMIGPIEKGFNKAELVAPPQGSFEGVDLSILPKYIAYKSALLKEKMILNYVVAIISVLFFSHYLVSRLEISKLHGQLREKEYILAPGVLDFTKASPQMIPNSYIHDAATDFLSSLGNISASNIDEQYSSLKRFMSKELRVQFSVDTADWIEQVKTDNISQILKVTDVEITSNSSGAYQVIALGRVSFYSEQQFLGHEDQVIKMILKLVPPESGKRWYLQIGSLSWEKAETFRAKSNLSKPNSKSKQNSK